MITCQISGQRKKNNHRLELLGTTSLRKKGLTLVVYKHFYIQLQQCDYYVFSHVNNRKMDHLITDSFHCHMF